MITDFVHNETVYVPYLDDKRQPSTMRCQFVRVAKPITIPTKNAQSRSHACFVLLNEKGTEIVYPVRYVYKSEEDARERAVEMTR